MALSKPLRENAKATGELHSVALLHVEEILLLVSSSSVVFICTAFVMT